MKSWQVFSAARKTFKGKFREIYGNRSSRLVDAWAQDPQLSSTAERNPIDRLEELLLRLCEHGEDAVAQTAVRILAAAAGCEICECNNPEPTRDTVLGEMADDVSKLAAFQVALQGNDLEALDRAKAALILDLEESREMFLRERGFRHAQLRPGSIYK